MKETVDLSSTVRGSQGFSSSGLEKIAVLQRVQGKPKLKQTNACRIQREFISMRKMKKLMKQKEDVFLCIVKAEKVTTERQRRSRGGKKMKSVETTLSNIVAQDSHGITEKTKREHSKLWAPRRYSRRLKKGLKKLLKEWRKNTRRNCKQSLQNFVMCSRTNCPKGLPQKGRLYTQ